jgi:site-specific recombinase XerD
MQQRRASPHTIASYRDTFRLLLAFAKERLHKNPSEIELTALDTTLVAAFLHFLETKRKSSIRTRNIRLAALHSFFCIHSGESMLSRA